MSAAFCDTHFRGMEQKAHSIVLPSVVLKGRYYMTQGQDLLTGSVPKKLIRFAFPLFLANLLQALYNVVDMLVVGKIVGKTGLAAISNASLGSQLSHVVPQASHPAVTSDAGCGRITPNG